MMKEKIMRAIKFVATLLVIPIFVTVMGDLIADYIKTGEIPELFADTYETSPTAALPSEGSMPEIDDPTQAPANSDETVADAVGTDAGTIEGQIDLSSGFVLDNIYYSYKTFEEKPVVGEAVGQVDVELRFEGADVTGWTVTISIPDTGLGVVLPESYEGVISFSCTPAMYEFEVFKEQDGEQIYNSVLVDISDSGEYVAQLQSITDEGQSDLQAQENNLPSDEILDNTSGEYADLTAGVVMDNLYFSNTDPFLIPFIVEGVEQNNIDLRFEGADVTGWEVKIRAVDSAHYYTPTESYDSGISFSCTPAVYEIHISQEVDGAERGYTAQVELMTSGEYILWLSDMEYSG